MISYLLSISVLIVGYAVYGRIAEKVFGPDGRVTPAIAVNDGVDCVPLPLWKSFLIQLLNIAGTGPIFGALMGAVFGPVVFLWIVFGSILGGAVHDYMCGMISSRHEGQSISRLAGLYLGRAARWILGVFSVVLLVLCGTVFLTSPAKLLAMLTPDFLDVPFWVIFILIYYVLATLLPIDKLIGRLYPVFGIILIIMALGIGGALVLHPGAYVIPEISLKGTHPDGLSPWPFMFVTVACGAISGFHATQSPMISKCITSEKQGRCVFYGAMLCESVIALTWAAAGVAFYGTAQSLQTALDVSGQSGVVYEISTGILGKFGGVLAVIGVIICPISSGDTAFRSARLLISEHVCKDQRRFRNRLIITIPLLLTGGVLAHVNFDVLWRYFSWSNQTLASVALWTAAAYLLRQRKTPCASLITALPAAFMSAVSMTYILMSPEGFRLSSAISCPAGCAFALVLFTLYLIKAFFGKERSL